MNDEPEIDDDHFEYEVGAGIPAQRQCISGFGENACGYIASLELSKDDAATAKYHIRELVRWCRALNRELKEAKL